MRSKRKSDGKAQAAMQLIEQGNAAGKTVVFDLDNSNPSDSFYYFMRQLINPEINRPVVQLNASADRNQRYNPQTNAWEEHKASAVRGAPKPGAKFTKKTPVSVIPPSQNMWFFDYNKSGAVGFMFDVNKVNLKGEKYVWTENVSSNKRGWIKGNTYVSVPRSAGLTGLQAYYEKNKYGEMSNTEQLFGLCKEALIALFVQENTFIKDPLFMRINVLRAQFAVKDLLGLELPILILNVNGQAAREYTKEQQIADIESIEHDSRRKDLLQAFGTDIEQIKARIRGAKVKVVKTHTPIVNEDKDVVGIFFEIYKPSKSSYWTAERRENATLLQIIEHANGNHNGFLSSGYSGKNTKKTLVKEFGITEEEIETKNIPAIRNKILNSQNKANMKFSPNKKE